jgi:hypothetical protein
MDGVSGDEGEGAIESDGHSGAEQKVRGTELDGLGDEGAAAG